MPFPESEFDDTALASGHPSQPPVFTRLVPVADRLMVNAHCTGSVTDGAVGVGVGAGSVGVGVGAGADEPVIPSRCVGIRAMNTSARLPPMFDVQRKYSPVGSMFPLGRLEYASLPPPDAFRSVMFGATTSTCIDPSSR